MKAHAPRPPDDFGSETTSLIVRPDLLRVTFVAEAESGRGEQGIAGLERAAAALRAAVTGVHSEGSLVLRGFELRRQASLKSRSCAEDIRPTISGALEVPLALELDYWGRARLVARLWAVTEVAVAEGLRSKPKIRASFGAPVALLRAPEVHRQALLRRRLGRIRELSEEAAASGLCAGLRLRSCALPGPVEQRTRSLEEVELELDLVIEGPLEAIDPGPARSAEPA